MLYFSDNQKFVLLSDKFRRSSFVYKQQMVKTESVSNITFKPFEKIKSSDVDCVNFKI